MAWIFLAWMELMACGMTAVRMMSGRTRLQTERSLCTELVDTDGDGMADTRMAMEEVDLDGDGIADGVAYVFDRDFDMNPDMMIQPVDLDGDGIIDQFVVMEDRDGRPEF